MVKELKIKNNKIFLSGDWNSQIGRGQNGEYDTAGRYGYVNQNSRSWRLIRFCHEYNLKMINGFFKKRCGKRWSWVSPNQEYRTLIDFVITQKSNNSIVDYNINRNFNFHSDHRPLTTKIEIANPPKSNPFHKNKKHQRIQPPKISERNHHTNRNNRKESN